MWRESHWSNDIQDSSELVKHLVCIGINITCKICVVPYPLYVTIAFIGTNLGVNYRFSFFCNFTNYFLWVCNRNIIPWTDLGPHGLGWMLSLLLKTRLKTLPGPWKGLVHSIFTVLSSFCYFFFLFKASFYYSVVFAYYWLDLIG